MYDVCEINELANIYKRELDDKRAVSKIARECFAPKEKS